MRRKDPPPSIRATEVLFHVEHTRMASTNLPWRHLWIDGQVFHVKPGPGLTCSALFHVKHRIRTRAIDGAFAHGVETVAAQGRGRSPTRSGQPGSLTRKPLRWAAL